MNRGKVPEEELVSAQASETTQPIPFGGTTRTRQREEPQNILDLMKPDIEGLPWTAPFYRGAFTADTYPKPHCIIVNTTNRCTCYTQQATKLQLPDDSCRWYAQNGFFDPTRKEAERGQRLNPLSAAAPANREQEAPPVRRNSRIVIPLEGVENPVR